MLETLITHLNDTKQAGVLRTLFKAKSFEAFMTECGAFIGAQPARMVADLSRLRHEANKLFESLGKVQAHAKRSTTKPIREYVEALSRLVVTFKESPTKPLWCVLNKHAEHATSLVEELQDGEFGEQMALINLEVLREDLAKNAEEVIKRIGKSSNQENDRVDKEDVHDHDKFVRALSKEFDIEVHHFEPVNEGVFIFIDEENNDELLRGLKSMEDRLNKITAEMGYILVRKGTSEDIVWGSYPNGLAKWMFIKCPQDSEVAGNGGQESWADNLDDLEIEIMKQAKLDPKDAKDTKKVGRDVRAENSATTSVSFKGKSMRWDTNRVTHKLIWDWIKQAFKVQDEALFAKQNSSQTITVSASPTDKNTFTLQELMRYVNALKQNQVQ